MAVSQKSCSSAFDKGATFEKNQIEFGFLLTYSYLCS